MELKARNTLYIIPKSFKLMNEDTNIIHNGYQHIDGDPWILALSNLEEVMKVFDGF